MISIYDIIKILRKKNPTAIPQVIKSYKLADYAHYGVFRESGEPYITHPLNVALNVLKMEVYDTDTISAALLHDTVEDNEEITLDLIAHEINPTVAKLVDGVTKISRMEFPTKQEQNYANMRKLITGLNIDLRIILIKLADRKHNMETLQAKKPEKQIANAEETKSIFVPIAEEIGAYQIRNELDDLSILYLDPDAYNAILERREELAEKEKDYLEEMKDKIKKILAQKNIPSEILIRTKNVCNIYSKIDKQYKVENIYDLFYLKILVDEVDDCYRTLSIIHRYNTPINGRFKDYIYNPRTNYYQSLHTTVSDESGRLRKVKVRTNDMDKISAFGICAYWNIKQNKPESEIPHYKNQEQTQKEIRNNQFARKLAEIDSSSQGNKEFMEFVEQELFTEHVYVYKHTGETIELPKGATALDFACEVYPELLDKMTGVTVNGKEVKVSTVLKNHDRVEVKTDGMINHDTWEKSVTTSKARHKINYLTHRQN